jgi:hypothetical protein
MLTVNRQRRWGVFHPILKKSGFSLPSPFYKELVRGCLKSIKYLLIPRNPP